MSSHWPPVGLSPEVLGEGLRTFCWTSPRSWGGHCAGWLEVCRGQHGTARAPGEGEGVGSSGAQSGPPGGLGEVVGGGSPTGALTLYGPLSFSSARVRTPWRRGRALVSSTT